jgi:hypothetical protein
VTAHLSPRGEHFLKGSPTLQDGQAQLHSMGSSRELGQLRATT